MPGVETGESGNPSGRPGTKLISDHYAYIAEEKLPENIQKKLKLKPAATLEIREAIEGKGTIPTDEERPPIRGCCDAALRSRIKTRCE
jgi:hypothetical protein